MAYTYDPIFAFDPNNPANIARSASITIFDPADATKAPIALTDPTGVPLPNPITVDAQGMGPAFQHPTLARVGWTGAGLTNYLTSYEGMFNETTAAKAAAQSAANDAASAVADRVTAATVNGSGKLILTKGTGATVDAGSVIGPKGDKGDKGLDGANVLPTAEAIAQAVTTDGPAKTALSATILDVGGDAFALKSEAGKSRLAAVSILRAAMLTRETEPVVVVGTGSSTMAGSKSGTIPARWFSKFGDYLAEAFPMASGVPSQVDPLSLAEAVAAPPTTGGIWLVNAGIVGTSAETFLTDTTGPQVAALDPRMVVIGVGSNDYAGSVTLTNYKTRLQNRIAQLKADTAGPCVYLLIHQHQTEAVTSPAYNWEDYGRIMAEIADEDPENVAFLDLSDDFAAVGIPGADPFALRDADLAHLNAAGHDMFATLVRDSLSLIRPVTAAASGGGTVTQLVPVTLTTDSFTGTDGTIFGRTTDAANGGFPKAWETSSTTSNAVVISSGVLTRGSDSFSRFYGIAIPGQNVEISFKITAIPTTGDLMILARRTTLASGNRMNIKVTTAGTAFIARDTTSLSSSVAVAVGDTLALRCIGTTHSLYKNGVKVATVENADAGTVATHAGILAGSGVGFGLDNLKIVTFDTV